MFATSLQTLKDRIHAILCYQLFITPIPKPIEKEYKEFAEKACAYLQSTRNETIMVNSPRHHVIHHFSNPNPKAAKILIAHGWMSCSAYMASIIESLHSQGFEIYAVDFPAHGESKGFQLPWTDAVSILRQTINKYGPFYGAIGHSFGGSMLLNMLNLSPQHFRWRLDIEPQKVVLISSPTNMRDPVNRAAERLGLSKTAYVHLRNTFINEARLDVTKLDYQNYVCATNTDFLCIHGKDDKTVSPDESIKFCHNHPQASLSLIAGIDHVGVLIDKRVQAAVKSFFTEK